MDRKAGAAGLAALAICESLLLSLTENKILAAGEARSILEDAAAANRNAIPLTPDGGHARGGRRRDRADPRRRQLGPVRMKLLGGGADRRGQRLGIPARHLPPSGRYTAPSPQYH